MSYIRKPEISVFIVSLAVFLHTLLTNLDHGLWIDELITIKLRM